MGIGINIKDNIKISLKDNKDSIIEKLNTNKIEYNIPFDKNNKLGDVETIIVIKEPRVEISLYNNSVTYIKTNNNEFSTLVNINDNENLLKSIQYIKDTLNDKFLDKGSIINIEKLDSRNLNMTLQINYKDACAKIYINKDSYGNVFINGIKSI